MFRFVHSVRLFLFFISLSANGQVITTFAGNHVAGSSGDGGQATLAELFNPSGVAVDGSGNVYISDTHNNRIRMVNASGIIVTIAGTGIAGNSGDGGPATVAELNNPAGIAVDGGGNLFIADFYNNKIRKITATGMMSTIAGNDTPGFSGDGGIATAAELSNPTSVAVDIAGNVYIADHQNSRIRRVDASGIITTIAGNGLTSFSGDGGPATDAELDPRGVAVDNSGNIYIADYGSSRIRKINTAGIISTIAGNGTPGYSGDGGPATHAELYYVTDVAADAAGNVYIADVGRNCIRKVDTGGIISTVAGNGTEGSTGDGGPATDAQLDVPIAVAVDGPGNIYIADYRANCVRKVSAYNNSIAENQKPAAMHLLQLYPDNNRVFAVSVNSAINEPARIIVTNINGQIINELDATTNKQVKICLDGPPGLYFVTAFTQRWSESAKVMLK